MIDIAIAQRGGVARRSELLVSTGMHPRALDRALARLTEEGAIIRPHRGLYALPDLPEAQLVAAIARGAVTCVSAAQDWELPLLEPPGQIHIAVPRSTSGKVRRLVPDGVNIHWDSAARPSRGRPDPGPMFRHLVDCLPLREVVTVADAALRRRLVKPAVLAAERPRRRWVPYERMLHATDPESQSIGESLARVGLAAAGLRVETQVQLAGVGRVDMLVEGTVVVEIDGFAYHSGRREYREDRRRDRVAMIHHGLPVLRFSHEDAVYATARLVEDVRAAVALHR